MGNSCCGGIAASGQEGFDVPEGCGKVISSVDEREVFLEELVGKRLLHVRGLTDGFLQLETAGAASASEQQQKAVDAMMAFNPDYLVVDGSPYGSGFQHYCKAFFDSRGAFMDPPMLLRVASRAQGANSWAEQGFSVTTLILKQDEKEAQLRALFGPGAPAALAPLGGGDRGGAKILEGAAPPDWVQTATQQFQELIESVEKRSSSQYFAKRSLEAAAEGAAAFELLRNVQADAHGVVSFGGDEREVIEFGAVYLNSLSGVNEDDVALFPFVAEASPNQLGFRLHVGEAYVVEDMEGWMRQISGQAPAPSAEKANKVGQDPDVLPLKNLDAPLEKQGKLGPVVRNWQDAVLADGNSTGVGAVQCSSLSMTPLLDGIENLVDVLQQLAKDRGLGDHLKADLAKIRRSKAPALQEGDDFKTWLLGEMPVHAATKYKSYVDDSAFMGQLWVGRQLEFWVEVISALSDGKASSAAVDAAYKATLKKHHGILQAAAFSAVLKGLPSREELLGLLRGEAEETVLRKELKAFVDSGRAIAKYMLALDKEIDALRANERRNFSQ